MSETNPPIPFPLNPIFNITDWVYPDIALTIAVANSLYLKRAGDSATGLISFNSGLTCAGLCQISCNITLNGVSASNRQITASYLNLNDITNNASVLQVYPTSTGVVYYDNNFNSGSHQFAVNNSSGVQTIPLSLNSVGAIISTNNPASSSSSFTVVDSSTSNQLVVIPNVGGGLYNASTDLGNILLLGTSTSISSETIQLSTWSSTNNYVKIRPTSVGMGAGGATSSALSSVECNGSTVRIVPSITFPDNSVQTTAFTGGVGVPTGSLLPYTGTTAPTGFLMCNGAVVSQTTYASLYAVVGSTYGSNAGGNFTLPDLRNRAPFGSASINPLTGITLDNRQLGVVYSPQIYGGNQTMTTQQIASHTHILTFPTANYVDSVNTTNNTTTGGSGSRAVSGSQSVFPTASGANSNLTTNHGQDDYLPPFCCVNYIIKT